MKPLNVCKSWWRSDLLRYETSSHKRLSIFPKPGILGLSFRNGYDTLLAESPVTLGNNNAVSTFTSEYTNYFLKGINSAGRSETACNHRIKYIMFKGSSSKSNEVFFIITYI